MSFWIFGKKEYKSRYNLYTDIHSHILPGIDDGSKSLSESLDMLKAMQEASYTKVITTPHIMADVYKNTPSIIKKKLTILKDAAAKNGINIQIDVAAEYYLDDGFIKHLQSGEILSFGKNYLLFETSYMDRPINLEEMIFEIQSNGYTPVLAHPERYRYINNLESEYARLKELGVLFQLNLNSLIGGYGKSAKKKADYLVKRGMVNFLGSDAHGLRHIEGVKKVKTSELFDTIFKNNNILNDTL